MSYGKYGPSVSEFKEMTDDFEESRDNCEDCGEGGFETWCREHQGIFRHLKRLA